jgi:menaquinone-dependent protoporphyrinogen oxidase
MSADRVLVAFASQNGSTAWIAEAIAAELQAAGLAVDCRPVAEVADLACYGAVVLGSGVFLARRHSDGGGFLVRHAEALAQRPVWLFSGGPIGGAEAPTDGDPLPEEAPVVRVAHAIGARGAATFGTAVPRSGPIAAGPEAGDWRDPARVHGWARSIAAALHREGTLEGETAAGAGAERPRPKRTKPSSMVVTR